MAINRSDASQASEVSARRGGERLAPADRIPFTEALRFWVKLGFISFGGPAGQIAIMHRELVDRRCWISEERFLHALNYCMLLPGPEAQQLAIYIGWLLHRKPGGILAGALFVIPSIFILLFLSYIYAAYGQVAAVAGVLVGFKPVVVAIVVEAVLKIGGRALKRSVHYVIAALSFISIYFLHVPFPVIVLTAGLVGLAFTRYWPDRAPEKAAAEKHESRTVIDDEAPPPPHTLPSRRRALRTFAVGIVLWALPFAAIVAWRGWSSLHAQTYCFFTQAALVTFGGAYWPEARKILLVQDNLNTHNASSFYEHLPAAEALALAQKFDFHYTPKSASWLNMIEIEFSALARECLLRRIPSQDILEREVLALVKERADKRLKINWQFSLKAVRKKLNSHYSRVNVANCKYQET